AKGTDELADVAQLALLDISATWQTAEDREGLTVAQLFLNADIDAAPDQAGKGANGGIATLLVRLGNALSAGPGGVAKVITMSRGSVKDALASAIELPSLTAGHGYGRIPLLSEPVSAAAAWPLRVTA